MKNYLVRAESLLLVSAAQGHAEAKSSLGVLMATAERRINLVHTFKRDWLKPAP